LKHWSTIRWSRGEQKIGSLSYRVLRDNHLTGLGIINIGGARSRHLEDYDFDQLN